MLLVKAQTDILSSSLLNSPLFFSRAAISLHPSTAGVAGFEHRKGKALMVDLLATSLTLAWVEDVLIAVVFPLPEETLSSDMKLKVLRAVNRILYVFFISFFSPAFE